ATEIGMTKAKLLFVAVLILFAEPALAQPAQLTVSIGKLEAAAGTEAAIPIVFKGATSVGAVHVEVMYDPQVLEFKEVVKGSLFSGNAMIDSNGGAPGRLIVGLVSLDPVSGDGPTATARFNVKGAAGQTSPLKLQNLRAWDNKSHAELLVSS